MVSEKEYKYVRKKVTYATLPDDFTWNYYFKICEGGPRNRKDEGWDLADFTKFLRRIEDRDINLEQAGSKRL